MPLSSYSSRSSSSCFLSVGSTIIQSCVTCGKPPTPKSSTAIGSPSGSQPLASAMICRSLEVAFGCGMKPERSCSTIIVEKLREKTSFERPSPGTMSSVRQRAKRPLRALSEHRWTVNAVLGLAHLGGGSGRLGRGRGLDGAGGHLVDVPAGARGRAAAHGLPGCTAAEACGASRDQKPGEDFAVHRIAAREHPTSVG